MLIPANDFLADSLITEILGLSLDEKLEWKENENQREKAIRLGKGPDVKFVEVETGIHTSIDGYAFSLYKVDIGSMDRKAISPAKREGHILYVYSYRHERGAFFGSIDGDSFNQDLVTIYRKLFDPEFPKTESTKSTFQGLDHSLIRFFEN